MFDFSFAELMMIMVVALVVIGPERLPKVARTMGHLYGRAQRYVNGVKSDIARDMAMDDYRKLQEKVQAEAASLQQSVQQAGQVAEQHMQQINRAVAEPLPEVYKPVVIQSSAVIRSPAVIQSHAETAQPKT